MRFMTMQLGRTFNIFTGMASKRRRLAEETATPSTSERIGQLESRCEKLENMVEQIGARIASACWRAPRQRHQIRLVRSVLSVSRKRPTD